MEILYAMIQRVFGSLVLGYIRGCDTHLAEKSLTRTLIHKRGKGWQGYSYSLNLQGGRDGLRQPFGEWFIHRELDT